MKHRVELPFRTSFDFSDGYAGEFDDWLTLCTASAFERRLVTDDGQGSRTYTQRVTLTPQELATAKRHYRRLANACGSRGLLTLTDVLEMAIQDLFSVSYCRHEHDCCGCWSTYAHAVRVKSREFHVRLHATANL